MASANLEFDYLVVGTSATGMAFTTRTWVHTSRVTIVEERMVPVIQDRRAHRRVERMALARRLPSTPCASARCIVPATACERCTERKHHDHCCIHPHAFVLNGS